MNLENLNFSEEPLSREDLLRIKGGASALYSTYSTGNCEDTNNDPHQPDCDDIHKDYIKQQGI